MTLDATKWASGSDGDVNLQPVIDTASEPAGVARLTWAFTPTSGGVFAGPSDGDTLDAFWIQLTSNRKYPLANDGGGLQVVDVDHGYGVSRGDWLVSPDEKIIGGMGSEVTAYVDSNVQSGVSYQLHMFTPYYWRDLDLAELIFAWTRFYTDGGVDARDELDSATFQAYSSKMADVLYGVRFWAWREVNETIAEMIRDVASQSGAFLGWGAAVSGVLNFNLRLVHPEDAAANTAVFDYADRGDMIVARAIIQSGEDFRANLIELTYGSFAKGTFEDGTIHSWSFSSPFSHSEHANRLEYVDAVDRAKYGTRQARITRRHLLRDSYADASLLPWWWKGTVGRRVSFSQGPLHYDYLPGDKVHHKDEERNLDGTEGLLVLRKTIDFNTHVATIEALEIIATIDEIEPDDEQVADSLQIWLDADVGVSVTGSDVDLWADQQKSNDATYTGMRGTAAKPTLLTNHKNGRDVVDFTTALTGLNHNNSIGLLDDGAYTFIAVVETRAGDTADGWLWDSNTTGGGQMAIGRRYTGGSNYYGYDDGSGRGATEAWADGWQVLVWRFEMRDGGDADATLNVGSVIRSSDLAGIEGTYQIESDAVAQRDCINDVSLGCNQAGAGNGFRGKLAELLVYNRALVPSEMRRIVAGLSTKWGV